VLKSVACARMTRAHDNVVARGGITTPPGVELDYALAVSL